MGHSFCKNKILDCNDASCTQHWCKRCNTKQREILASFIILCCNFGYSIYKNSSAILFALWTLKFDLVCYNFPIAVLWISLNEDQRFRSASAFCCYKYIEAHKTMPSYAPLHNIGLVYLLFLLSGYAFQRYFIDLFISIDMLLCRVRLTFTFTC